MNIEYSQTHLSNEELALLAAGKAHELLRGEKSRDDFYDDLVILLATEDNVIVRQAPLRSQGRCSFGRQNEGRDGIALFIPQEAEK